MHACRSTLEDPTVYQYLREGVDYYLDPSNLWFALVSPLALSDERLLVAYRVRINGQDTIDVNTGGTPDLEYDPNKTQVANLVWDPEVVPGDTAFYYQMRNVYRVGGEDIQRQTVTMAIVAGAGGDQAKPVAGPAQSYLEMFGLSQRNNAGAFDVDNRLWPRPNDPNVNRDAAAGGTNAKLIRDYFLIFPSLEPFARTGLATPAPNPANDTIYAYPEEYLYSAQHPQALYRIREHYQAQGGGDVGTLTLGSVQIRRLSEHILVDGIPLTRDVDYTVNYDLGQVKFTRPDTLFPQARQVSVQYEENPLFAAAPTSIFGIASEFPLQNGSINFTAISQSQKTTFNRPPLGFEPASSLVAGVSGNFTFEASGLTRFIDRLPMVQTTQPSIVNVTAEMATSRPQPNAAGQAYVESFEGEGGVTLPLADAAWYYSSIPVAGTRLPAMLGGIQLDSTRATTMAWQNNGLDINNQPVLFHIENIDSLTAFAGNGVSAPEQILWMTLYPQWAAGGLNNYTGVFQWQPGGIAPAGRRWRSIRTSLGASGADLSRVESLEFWTLVETDPAKRPRNPMLVFDFGDISENSLSFAPTRLLITPNLDPAKPRQAFDSLYTGRRTIGFDRLDSERDPFSRTFNVSTNDLGLPGDRIDTLLVRDSTGSVPRDTVLTNYAMCDARGGREIQLLGDAKVDCTVNNSRLDEEDLDLDGVLNLSSAQQNNEQVLRYVVDLSDPSTYNRFGGSVISVDSVTLPGGQRVQVIDTLRWVQVRVPFRAPTDSVGNPLIRRMKALRLTMISGAGMPDSAFTREPIARLKLVGAPWLKRADLAISGVAGDQSTPGGGQVIASIIGTQDRDSTRGLFYESPPGVVDQPDSKTTAFQTGLVQINEKSLRLTATDMQIYRRAEAYIRFPEGSKNFMGYKELRVWARGRNDGWGENGELQFFIKIGRDAENFYMYRTPVVTNSWLPEVKVDFEQLFALRAKVQNAYLQGTKRNTCTGIDSTLIAKSVLSSGTDPASIYAACANGYMVLTADPSVTPPNLAAVAELSVGMIRVDSAPPAAPGRIIPGDTLELWVDDIRLTNVVDAPGYAGQVGLAVSAGDLADMRVNISRRDPNFRQLAEQPSFVTEDELSLASNLHVDKFLPASWGLSLPVSVSYSRTGSDPYFISQSDVRGAGISGLRTPRSDVTAMSFGIRRVTPLRNSAWAPLVNYLSISSAWASSNTRSEYALGTASNVNATVDYNVTAGPRERAMPAWIGSAADHLPGWIGGSLAMRALRAARLRWNPTVFHLTSALARANSNQTVYTRLAVSPIDTGRLSQNLTSFWRNGASIEFRPFQALTARMDVTSLRDLRDYGDTSATAVIASGERDKLLGVDLGLERNRTLQTGLSFSPVFSAWIRPHVDVGTNYDMSRDPNTRQLLLTGDTIGDYRLPRRIGNSQTLTTGAAFDIGRGILIHTADRSFFRHFVNVFQPFSVTVTRSLASAFDGVPFTPDLFYQFGFGNTNAFRSQQGRVATSAVFTRSVQWSHAVSLPFGTSISNRYQHTITENYARRLGNTQGLTQGDNLTYPSLSLRWSYRPLWLRNVLTSIGSSVGYERSVGSTYTPPDAAGGPAEFGEQHRTNYPVSVSLAWAFAGGFSTSGGVTTAKSEQLRPGSRSTGTNRDVNLDFGKGWKLPQSWNMRSDLRTHVTYARSHAQSFALNSTTPSQQSRLADNGSNRLSLNADTDVAENLSFSLVGSRIVNFDNNFNRRFTQTVLTAVLHFQFFAGQLR